MFNTFLAERSLEKRKQNVRKQKKLANWFRKYKTEVRPNLVERYQRRINGFAKKVYFYYIQMEDQPVVLNEEEKPTLAKLFRVSDHKLNISDKSFKFKDAEDWKSIFSPGERIMREKQINSVRKNIEEQHLIFRSIGSQSQYTQKLVEYRTRNPSKQINPPMKYNNKNSKLVFDSLPAIKAKKKQKLQTRNRRQTQQNVNLSRQSISSDLRQSQNPNISDLDLASLYNSSLIRKKQLKKTQLEIIQQEQLKALAHSKLYFKGLLQLQQNMKTKKQKDEMKQVLKKCKVIKNIRTQPEIQQEKDNFIQMLKSK